MKKGIWIVIVIAIVGALGWLNYSKSNQISGETIKLGGAFALTGIGAEIGEGERNAAVLAIEEANENGGINGRQVELIVEDTGTDSTKTVSAVSKLININKVSLILGPSWLDNVGGGVLPFSDNNNVIMITSSAGITAIQSQKIHKNVFSTYYRSDKEVEQLAQYVMDSGKKKIAILMQTDPYWDDLSQRIKNLIESKGQTVREIHFASREDDFKTYFATLKNENTDAIIFGFNSDEELLPLLKQKAQIYPSVPMYTTEYIEGFIPKQEYSGLTNNIFYITPKVNENEFTKKYKGRFNQDAILATTNSYDATKIILEAMKEGNLDTDSIRDYLKTHEFDTLTFGKTRFDELGGVTIADFVIKEIKNNQGIEVQ